MMFSFLNFFSDYTIIGVGRYMHLHVSFYPEGYNNHY